MSVDIVIPWESPEWDRYVDAHPAATVFHTSAWCRIVAEIGRYQPVCLVSTDGDNVTGVMPAMDIRSRLTGNRMGTLPFSDECFILSDNDDAAIEMLRLAMRLRDERGVERFEMRGAPAIAGESGRNDEIATNAGFSASSHFNSYRIPLSEDTEAVRMTFGRKSVRQMISKAERMGVTVRRGSTEHDTRECYRLYALNRKQHGIPPQPYKLFATVVNQLRDDPEAIVYLAQYQGVNVASLLSLRYNGETCAKYEGIDLAYRHTLPIHALLWTSAREAAEAGDRSFDLGRTATDNPGLNDFKTRWGTEKSPLPYFYYPAGEGISVVKSDSWKYRTFTAVFQKLPVSISTRIGARLFRHFG